MNALDLLFASYDLRLRLRYTKPVCSTSMAKPGPLQTWVEYAAARSVVALLGLMPPRWAMATGSTIGSLAHLIAGKLKKTGERNLLIAFPEKSDEERKQILAKCFRNLGRQLGLFSKFPIAARQDLIDLAQVEGLEYLQAAKASGRSVILFTGHVGAWEMTSFGLSLIEHPLSFLVRRIDNPKIEDYVDRARTRFGNKCVDKRGAARSMLKILQSSGTLGLLVDLNTLDDEAIFVDFFGVPASTTFMVAKLALRTNAAVLPIFAPWDTARGKFLLHVLPEVQVERTGDEVEDVRSLTADLTTVVENYIRRYPEQWLWIHKRWKTRPAGGPDLYQSHYPPS